MEILVFFLLSLGAGEALSEGVPQPTWTYEPEQLIEYAPRDKNLAIIVDENNDVWLVPKYMDTR